LLRPGTASDPAVAEPGFVRANSDCRLQHQEPTACACGYAPAGGPPVQPTSSWPMRCSRN